MKHYLKPKVSTVKTIDGEDELKLRAVVSASVTDRDGDIVEVSSADVKRTKDGLIDIPLLVDHDYRQENIIGSVDSYEKRDDELIFDIRFAKHKMKAVMAYLDIVEGHIKNAFSIGFTYDRNDQDGNILKNISIHEVSVVVFASNPDARVLELIKSYDGDNKKLLTESYKELTKEERRKEQMNFTEDQIKSLLEGGLTKDQITSIDEAGISFDQALKMTVEAEEKAEELVEDAEEAEEKQSELVDKAVAKALKMAKDAEKADAVKKQKAIEKKAGTVINETKEAEDYRVRFVKGIRSFVGGNKRDFKEYTAIAKKSWDVARAEGKKDVITLEGIGAESLICYDVWRDIIECNKNYGALCNLVTRVNISQDGLKVASLAGELELTPIGKCELKPEMGEILLSDRIRKVTKYAGIKVWCDADAEDSPLAIFQILLRKLAQAERKNCDEVILNYDGGGNADYSSGILDVANSGVAEVDIADVADITTAVLAAECASECPLSDATLVMNCVTYNKILAAHGDPTDCKCKVTGSTDLGGVRFTTIWGFPVVVSNAMPDGKIIFGDFSQYLLLERSSLTVETSTEATVQLTDGSSVNLWQNDLTGLRAYLRRGGIVANPAAFTIFNCA